LLNSVLLERKELIVFGWLFTISVLFF